MRPVSPHCPKGCIRRIARHGDASISFWGARPDSGEEQQLSRLIPTPPRLQAEFDDAAGRTGLRSEVAELEVYDDLHGAGGMFDAGPWVVLVGARDVDDAGRMVVERWTKDLLKLYANGNGGARATPEELLAYAVEAAMRRYIAHGIGHALIAMGNPNPYQPDEEAGADYYAGKLDAARGRSRALGELVFHSIGCADPSCGHPSPTARVAAYGAGYDAQRRAS
jgi:hypothetical protein